MGIPWGILGYSRRPIYFRIPVDHLLLEYSNVAPHLCPLCSAAPIDDFRGPASICDQEQKALDAHEQPEAQACPPSPPHARSNAKSHGMHKQELFRELESIDARRLHVRAT